MEEYKLPAKWYIEITDENKQILNDWKIKQKYNTPIIKYNYVKYVNFEGCAVGRGRIWESLTQITTDEFIQYVLKQDVFPKNWAIKQDACQEACDWLNINFPKYVIEEGIANLEGGYAYITFEGKYIKYGPLSDYIEITKEQFIKHVLKEKNNHSKLINILKFIDKWKQ